MNKLNVKVRGFKKNDEKGEGGEGGAAMYQLFYCIISTVDAWQR